MAYIRPPFTVLRVHPFKHAVSWVIQNMAGRRRLLRVFLTMCSDDSRPYMILKGYVSTAVGVALKLETGCVLLRHPFKVFLVATRLSCF